MWISNAGSDAVTELSVSSGSFIRLLKSKTYEFHFPGAIAVSDGRVWIANDPGGAVNGSITEIDAGSGALIRVIR